MGTSSLSNLCKQQHIMLIHSIYGSWLTLNYFPTQLPHYPFDMLKFDFKYKIYINLFILMNNLLFIMTSNLNMSSPNNKSILALAGTNSIKNHLTYLNNNQKQNYQSNIYRKPNILRAQKNSEIADYGSAYKGNDILQRNKQDQNFANLDIKKLMIKLTLPRLRKIQALVRGFLVRRKIYPKKLQEYLIAKSVYQLILFNAVSKESSQIALQNITFPKYNQGALKDLYGNQSTLQDYLFDLIYKKATQKYLKTIVQQSLTQKALYFSRPEITFGFNLRSAEGLLLYDVLMKQIRRQTQKIAEESIREHADYWRQIKFMEQLIQGNNLLNGLYEEIIFQSYNENMGAIMANLIIERCVGQASHAVSVSSYEKQISKQRKIDLQDMQQQAWNQIIQQGILTSILQGEQ